MKPDVLQRLDAYCAIYGVGRGRAIGHLLKGALPDPNWLPATTSFLPGEIEDSSDTQTDSLVAVTHEDDVQPSPSDGAPSGSDGDAVLPAPLFQSGDRVANNSGSRLGRIGEDPCHWMDPVQLPSGEWRSGHWVYPVAWDGQSGLTIRYAEDLLRPAESLQQAG